MQDSEESDSDFDSDSDDSSSDEDEATEEGKPVLHGRAKWLKKTVVTKKKTFDSDDEGPQEESKEDRAKRDAEEEKRRKKREQELIDRMNAAAHRSKADKLDQNMTEEMLAAKVNEIVATRGKKGTNNKDVNRKLEVLAKISRLFGATKEIPVLMHLISSSFDSNKLIDDYLDLQTWRSSYRYLDRIVNVLEEEPDIVLSVLAGEDVMDDDDAEEEENSNVLRVTGSLESFISRLDADYTRSLQQINPHTQVNFLVLFVLISSVCMYVSCSVAILLSVYGCLHSTLYSSGIIIDPYTRWGHRLLLYAIEAYCIVRVHVNPASGFQKLNIFLP